MKKIILSIALLAGFGCYSQLFVSTDSYMYVGDQYVYVTQNTNMENDSSILLRREGQFLQGTTANSTNLGEGKLSVYQEGTVNNFAYNYWCSPIGNASAASGNENFGVSMLERPTTSLLSIPAIILPMSGALNGIANPLSIAPFWVYKFLSSNNYSAWIAVGPTANIAPGEGFTMKGTIDDATDDPTNPGESVANNIGSAQRYDFRGKPNDGNILITVADGMWTLTGNPYPSAIDLSAFLTDAVNTTGVAYFWEHDKTVNSHLILAYRGGYGTFSPISRGGTGVYVPATFYAYDISGNQLGVSSTPGNDYARYFSPVGQGFMIEGNALGTTATMSNSYRVFVKENTSTSVFERNTQSESTENSNYLPYIPSVSGFDYTTVSTDEVPQIRINSLLNEQAIKQFVIAFDDAATDGLDHAKDAKNANAAAVDVNFDIENKDCVLNVIQFDESKRLPLVIKSNGNVSYKIQVAEIINFNQSQNVYLFDAETNLYHDIKNQSYQFVLPQGNYKNRFEITFRNEMLSNNDVVKSNVVVYQNNSAETLFVSNPNMYDIKTINLYDINGKKIIEREKLSTENEYKISTVGLSDSVYIVEIFTKDNQKFSQKVIIAQGK